MMDSKPWYLSKTVWTNFILFIGAILVTTGAIDAQLSPETVAMIITIANVVLRFISGSQIEFKKK
jgi:hypothetical protein